MDSSVSNDGRGLKQTHKHCVALASDPDSSVSNDGRGLKPRLPVGNRRQQRIRPSAMTDVD